MKQLFTLLCIILVFCCLSVPALAAESDIESAPVDESVSEDADKADAAIADDIESDENVFEVIYREAISHSAEIFGLLSFIGTLIVAFLYKRGIMPLIKGGVGAVADTVCAIRERAESDSIKNDGRSSEILGSLKCAEDALSVLSDKLSSLEADLSSIESIERSEKSLRDVLSVQIDMLEDIFLSSSLPEYKKAAVGERVVAMKKELGYADESDTKKEQ